MFALSGLSKYCRRRFWSFLKNKEAVLKLDNFLKFMDKLLFLELGGVLVSEPLLQWLVTLYQTYLLV